MGSLRSPSSPGLRTNLVRGALLLPLAVVVVLHLRWPTGTFGDATYLAVAFTAVAIAWLGAFRAPPAARLVPLLIAAGVTAASLGDLVYDLYKWTGTEPDVSLADIPWFASYLGLGAALLITLVRRRAAHRVDADAVIDAMTVVTVSVLLFWELSVHAIVSDATVSQVVRGVWAAYPVADAVLCALVLRALASRRSRAALGFTFAFGVVGWLVSDVLYLLLALSGTYTRWLDLGWLMGALLMARSAWRRPAAAPVEDDEDGTIKGRGLGRIAMAVVPLTVPGGMELFSHLRGGQGDPLAATVAMAVLLVLAYVRTARLLKSEQRARGSARQSHRHYAQLAANSSDAVVVVDTDGRLTTESPQLAALVGFDGPTTGVDAMRLLAPADAVELRAVLARVAASPGEVFETEVRVDRVTSGAWVSARIVNLVDDPDVGGVVIALHDISDRKQAESELVHQAFHDVLTGLPNRALFRDRVEHALRRNARTGLGAAVLYLDLDGFKNVNDTLGHDAGDELLRDVAKRLVDAVRSEDTVARLGGDEFAILVEQNPSPVDEATTIAERVLRALVAPFEIGGTRVAISASIGIDAGEDQAGHAMLRNADIAMYRAKTGGKAKWVTYEPHMRVAAMERLQIETDLDGALERDEFRLVYQPVVRLESQEIVGFEALLRWHHPRLGVIGPDRFIHIAEETGSIVPIGEWVLRTACDVGSCWQREYPRDQPLTMAVNLSARQLAADGLVAQVAEALAASRLEPTTLVLEMTETVLIQDATLAARRLHELRALGVRLAIDDFGTGYSSLSYLRQFPVDILKIDRSFINTITDRTQIPAIVRGLLDLGRTLDLETIAEGVEEDVQRDGLRDEDCQLAQGYLFARPLDPVDAEAMLALMAPDGSATTERC